MNEEIRENVDIDWNTNGGVSGEMVIVEGNEYVEPNSNPR